MVATPSRSATPIGGTLTHDGLEPRSEVVRSVPRRSGNGADRQRARPEKRARALDSALLDLAATFLQLRAEGMDPRSGTRTIAAAFMRTVSPASRDGKAVRVSAEEYVRTLTPGDPLENDALNPIVYAVGAG